LLPERITRNPDIWRTYQRQRHGYQLERGADRARTVGNILMRQTGHAGDLKRLAAALRGGLTPQAIATLRTLLR